MEYNAEAAYFRLRNIQNLCNPVSSKFESILLVGGVDGGILSNGVIKYLFLGSTGQQLLGEQVILEEYLEDTVLLISYNAVSIYYHYSVDTIVNPIVAKWKNVLEYKLPMGLDDAEEGEQFKISSFISMVRHKKNIGCMVRDKDTMGVEKWPLIQTYGLDELKAGFFTMNHNVFDCYDIVQEAMLEMDEFAVKKVVMESEPALRKHWNDFVHHLDQYSHAYERTVKSEMQLADDIVSFYEFGIVRHEKLGLCVKQERGARLILGNRSCDIQEKAGNYNAEATVCCF